MIAYHILCHDNFEQVTRLVDALYTEQDVFLIDIDDGKRPDTSALEVVTDRPNVHVSHDANIGWGGSGTLRKTLNGAFNLLELDKEWDYYIVLSGQDLPLKSNDFIKEFLGRGAPDGTNYISCYQAPPLALDAVEITNKGRKSFLWGDRGHTRVYAKPGAINPQVNMYARTLVDVAEAGEDGIVYVGTVDRFTHQHRETFFQNTPYYTGANWFNLHRSLLEHMQNDPFAYELFTELKTTFIPDEAYFQTYIMNSKFRDTVSQDYGRLILRPGPVPRVKVFDKDDSKVIAKSKALFGRKFDARHDSDIVDQVLAARNTSHAGKTAA